MAANGDLNGAKLAVDDAAKMVDDAKPLFDIKMALGGLSPEDAMFAKQIKPLRVQIHRLCGQILTGKGDEKDQFDQNNFFALGCYYFIVASTANVNV